jgi:hypothetical protein
MMPDIGVEPSRPLARASTSGRRGSNRVVADERIVAIWT